MAVSSLLNPSSIVRERPTTAAAAQNFITGGAPLGQGVVASAANKIVGFQRGAAGVAARPPDLNSIIQTLSSNILNNVENRVQSINQNVTQLINQATDELRSDYRDRLDKVDAASPNKILQNFLDLYKEAIGYVQFLGDRKNIKALGENLKSIQTIFTETFNVVKIIRQTILNIVKQLSNLPSASTGAGGLNLDIAIPGGSLKKGPMSSLSRILRRGKPAMMLGGAALAGGLGANVVSGMMDIGGDAQLTPMSEGGISGSLLDRFNSILDRFSSAINSLSNVKRSQSSSGRGGVIPQTSGETPGATPGGAPSVPGTPQSAKPGVTTTGEKGVLDLIASVEQGPEGYDSFNTSAGKTPGKATQQTIGWLAKNARGAIGRYQQMPQFLLERAKRAGFDENTKFTPEVQDAITLNELRKSHSLDKFLGGEISEEQFLQKLAPTWRGLPQGQTNAARLGGTADMTYQDRYAGRNAAGKTYSKTIAELRSIRGGGNKPIATPKSQTPPTVAAATTQATTQQQLAQSVSKPAVQQTPQVNIAPLNLATPQAQSTQVGEAMAPPPVMSKGGVTVPFLSPSNHDNFLTLYSKMVYNIVDG